MTFQRKTVIRILLLIARMLADAPWQKEIEHLCNHISAAPTVEFKEA